MNLKLSLIWLRLTLSYLGFLVFCYCIYHYKTIIYLCYQAKGQIAVVYLSKDIETYKKTHHLTPQEIENLELVNQVKKFSVDSLAYLPTQNFTRIYEQDSANTLWVITASEPFNIKAYEWQFPIVGKVSYKGYFKLSLAELEAQKLRIQNYDVDIGQVSAWSTLGWVNDPLLSNTLKFNKAAFCNLLFHELFHATYYVPNKVNLNENLASFIAHKATLLFLKNDSINIKNYLAKRQDEWLFNNYMLNQARFLKKSYPAIAAQKNKQELKDIALKNISEGLKKLNFQYGEKYKRFSSKILRNKNACFIDFLQYHSLQDSIDLVFNKIYRGNLKKMVQSLK